MGPGIIIPVVILAVVVPLGLTWAKKAFKDAPDRDTELASPTGRLTGGALRELPSPPWRVVYEIAEDKLGSTEHVLIGPAGIFAVRTSMSAMPTPSGDAPDPADVARGAIVRGPLDDALRRCAMESDRLLEVHWAPPVDGAPVSVEFLPGITAIDGRRLGEWASTQPERLTPAQIDLAWQTVTTAIGRPDPLA
ncbi:MAG: hypothetical protein KDB37_02230 [Ilumatobacter sp.]|nr:hypothetical protein [Ilumatobacter sp.]